MQKGFSKIALIAILAVAGILAVVFFISMGNSKTKNMDIEITGVAMEPNYFDKEQYSIDANSYSSANPQRGDAVVIRRLDSGRELMLIKRVIGLPNEEIEIRDGKVYINGFPLSELYLKEKDMTYTSNNGFIKEGQKLTIPAEQHFLMGDNRVKSSDSRTWGFISKQDIVGKVLTCIANCSSQSK